MLIILTTNDNANVTANSWEYYFQFSMAENSQDWKKPGKLHPIAEHKNMNIFFFYNSVKMFTQARV